MARELIEAVAAHHQSTRRPIDFREHGMGGNDIFKAIGHGDLSSTSEALKIDSFIDRINLEQYNQYIFP
jgi:hypothetical protein